ncbi:hypothetical protein HU200_008987 [Digitaria exilis]|uniref:Uncharacterized protein n=1 Tax=Digitaria exilis TaxID=1010633 RepID=A0A835KPP1_9POAL|nr:hypothetical protein HU200_009037 [Digitaria exilis]KAF8762850.1 hypothetical protein HU200_008987 [Digitaria exilis]
MARLELDSSSSLTSRDELGCWLEVGRLPPVEAVLGELPAHLLHLSALLWRASVGKPFVDCSHGPEPSATLSLHMFST